MLEDDETIRMFIEESQEHLGGIEQLLLAIEEAGEQVDRELVNRVFRAIHSIKGGAGFFGLDKIKDLAHVMENVLNRVREGECVPTAEVCGALLVSADLLSRLVNNWRDSNGVDISEPVGVLERIYEGGVAAPIAEEGMSEATGQVDRIQASGVHSGAQVAHPDAAVESSGAGATGRYTIMLSVADHFNGKRSRWRAFLASVKAVAELQRCDCDEKKGPLRQDSVVALEVYYAGSADELAAALTMPVEAIVQVDVRATDVPAAAAAPVVQAMAERQTAGREAAPAPVATSGEKPRAVAAMAAASSSAATGSAASVAAESSLRVNVKLLDRLMNLAGELVLTRNQLSQAIVTGEARLVEQASQRLDFITSEMQETIMSTRMQPVAVVFSKFRRIVRDLSSNLGKKIELKVDGEDVELDKTIIEGLSDPLTHLVRNGIDHGIEMPADRVARGKPESAVLSLRAYHQAGQVVIEITDDGRGIDPAKIRAKALETGLKDKAALDAMSDAEAIRLIFAPGFSTAAAVTDISGRGVGMDVVNTNLSQLGGVVDLESKVDVGTTVRIKLPLTLAIISSLVVRLGRECYAIPQVNVQELVRVPPKDISNRLQWLGDSLILRLRGDLLPVIQLKDIVQSRGAYRDQGSGELATDRRRIVHDRREGENPDLIAGDERRSDVARRKSEAGGCNIVVLQTGSLKFGVVVDELIDSEEVVVKPLDNHLKRSRIYAGATIRGDGRVSMILDVVELSRHANLSEQHREAEFADVPGTAQQSGDVADQQSLVIVQGGEGEIFAIPVPLIARIEKIRWDAIERTGRRQSIVYRGGSLALLSMADVGSFKPLDRSDYVYVIVFSVNGREIGLLATAIRDTVNVRVELDRDTFQQPGIFGSAIIHDRTTFLVDLHGIVAVAEPDWIAKASDVERDRNSRHTILLVEDSRFFLEQLRQFMEECGYRTVTAMDGLLGLQALQENAEITAILTDIEMPNMNGLEFTRAVRGDPRFRDLPVIAVTSVSGDANQRKGFEAGVDAYLIKLDKEEILSNLDRLLKSDRKEKAPR
ncbi:MAG: chemotaxis protein CheW [Pseudomonadales bacterium]|nr:chemotaxis protein CheW [Pseudomonadales bacterium]